MSFYWLEGKRISTVAPWKEAVIDAACAERVQRRCADGAITEDAGGRGDVCKNDRSAWNVRFFRDVLDKAAGASSLNGLLLLILTKRGSCSICNWITEQGGRSQRKEMRLVQRLRRVSLFLSWNRARAVCAQAWTVYCHFPDEVSASN